jgi:hypothetical protein
VLVTVDRNLSFQQTFVGLPIAVIVLPTGSQTCCRSFPT